MTLPSPIANRYDAQQNSQVGQFACAIIHIDSAKALSKVSIVDTAKDNYGGECQPHSEHMIQLRTVFFV